MKDPKTTSFSLPPGCRFRPSGEELLRHYLAGKNSKPEEGLLSDLIGEVDVYGRDPFELPESACFPYGPGGKKRHWYCYVGGKGLKGAKRKAKSGFWRRRGKAMMVMGSGGIGVLGKKTMFEFYLGNSVKTAVRTDWVLYEYALIDHLKTSFVLCRVFEKPRLRNTISENGLVSCAEDSVSTVRHIGIQHDEDKCSIIKDNNEIDQNVTDSAPPLNFEFPMYLDPDAQMDMGNFTAQHLLAILQEDYLELDDLVD